MHNLANRRTRQRCTAKDLRFLTGLQQSKSFPLAWCRPSQRSTFGAIHRRPAGEQ
jgi:hypothetical protein